MATTSTARPMTLDTVALQLYTVREAMSRDPLGTLRQVATMGYRAVEFAGFGGIPVADLRATLDELGVHAMSAHIPFADFHGRLPAVLKDLQTLGCEHVVVPSVPEERRRDAAAVSQLDGEFQPVRGKLPGGRDQLRLSQPRLRVRAPARGRGGSDVLRRFGRRHRPGARRARARSLLGGARRGRPAGPAPAARRPGAADSSERYGGQ